MNVFVAFCTYICSQALLRKLKMRNSSQLLPSHQQKPILLLVQYNEQMWYNWLKLKNANV